MGQVIQVILTCAGPHQGTSEETSTKGGMECGVTKQSHPSLLSGLSLLPSTGYALLLAPQLHGPESAVFF